MDSMLFLFDNFSTTLLSPFRQSASDQRLLSFQPLSEMQV